METLAAPVAEQLLPSVTETAQRDPEVAAQEIKTAVLGIPHDELGIPAGTPIKIGSLDQLDTLTRTTEVPKVSGPTMGDLVKQ